MKLTRKQLTPQLLGALDAVAEIELPTALAYNVKRLKRKANTAFDETRELYTQKLKSFLVLDEAGNPIPEKDEEGNPIPKSVVFNSPTAQEDLKTFEKEFVDEEIDLKSYPITLSSLENAKISANVLDALEPVLFVEAEAELDA